MTKKIGIYNALVGGTSTLNNWKSGTKYEILNNNGSLPLRIDKFMAGLSLWHGHSTASYVGVIIHLSDTNGNTFADTIDGTGADTTNDVNTLMEKWKDYIWMTDFRGVGSGLDENLLTAFDFDAGTKRILEPGQKLYVSVMWMSGSDNSAQNLTYLIDYALWYQQAAAT